MPKTTYVQRVLYRRYALDLDALFRFLDYRSTNSDPFDGSYYGDEVVFERLNRLDDLLNRVRVVDFDPRSLVFYSKQIEQIDVLECMLDDLLEKYLSEYRTRHQFRPHIKLRFLEKVRIPYFAPARLIFD